MYFRPPDFFGQRLEVRFFYLPAPQARDSDLTGPAHVSCIGSAIFQKSAVGVRARVSRVRAPASAQKSKKFKVPKTAQKC